MKQLLTAHNTLHMTDDGHPTITIAHHEPIAQVSLKNQKMAKRHEKLPSKQRLNLAAIYLLLLGGTKGQQKPRSQRSLTHSEGRTRSWEQDPGTGTRTHTLK